MANKRIIELNERTNINMSDFLMVDDATGSRKLAMSTLFNYLKPTVKIATLAAGATSVTFTGIPTTGNNTIDIYTSKAGLDYDSVDDTTTGQLTYTFEAQSAAVTVYLVIREVS